MTRAGPLRAGAALPDRSGGGWRYDWTMKPRRIEKYTLGTLSDGSVVLELVLPTTGERWMLTFDEPGYEQLLEKLAHTKAIADQRRRAQTKPN